ncbi:TniB family NTP-binding protein [Kitasatospora sp. NPDC028055]|uniref:TniB family NTP-binding protein n=1 Tax=Kitasatospora sp. NPDC028055 TaxID=3155653 RepID=UPI0033CB5C58
MAFKHPGLAEPRTKEEWRGYLANVAPKPPEMPTYESYKAMNEDDREDFNDARDAYHSALPLISTPQLQEVHAILHKRIKVNSRQAAGARRGIVLDGPPTVGKSTTVKLFAADFEHRLRRRHPDRFAPGYIKDGLSVDYTPVVYLNIPSQATPKDLSMILADYMGMLYHPRWSKNMITGQVLTAMSESGVELVIIDDVHFLDLSAREGKVVNDHLKYLANHVAATFVYTGADLKTSGLFLEGTASGRATQTSGRNSHHQITNFPFKTTDDKTEWARTVLGMESNLRLFRHQVGALARLAPYLHDRTSGSIGALSQLIRESAITAVIGGQEEITRSIMDETPLGHHFEAAYAAKGQSRKPGASSRRAAS